MYFFSVVKLLCLDLLHMANKGFIRLKAGWKWAGGQYNFTTEDISRLSGVRRVCA